MNFADIEQTWRSPPNRPDVGQLETEKMNVVQTLHRRDRGFAIGLTLIFSALIVITATIVRKEIVGTVPVMDYGREWSVLLLLSLPWLGALWMVRRYRRQLAQQGDYTRSIAASVRALVAQNRFAQARARIILVLQAVCVPILALVIHQLQDVEKMRPHEAASAAALFGMVLTISFVGVWWNYARRLRPEQRRLETVLAGYDEAGAGAEAH